MDIDLKNYQQNYLDYIIEVFIEPNESELKEQLIQILKEDNSEKRFEYWQNIKLTFNQLKSLYKAANPFYIGFGNPNSEILFIGKEKAFNIYESPELFFHESINNLKQWENIKNGKNNDVFNPQNPLEYHSKKGYRINKQNTWGFYDNLTKSLTNQTLHSNTFFDNCFTTEINHIPSKYSDSLRILKSRKELLKETFFKNFKYVIIGAKGSVSEEEIKEIFNVEEDNEKNIELGKNKKTTFSITSFKNENQKIILCNQLSGATGWTKEIIEKLILEIKNE